MTSRDPWYWAHSARWRALGWLRGCDKNGWSVADRVPNSGIHLAIVGVHKIRVLRTLDGSTPPPGGNRARRQAGCKGYLGCRLHSRWGRRERFPPYRLSLTGRCRAIVRSSMFGLPKRPWDYQSGPELHWRVPVTGDATSDLARLTFDPGVPYGDVYVTLKIDPSEERGAG